jgi:hypothetical protein
LKGIDVISVGFLFQKVWPWPHATDTVMDILNSDFHYQIISNWCHDWFGVRWSYPPYSSDINPCDHFWWSLLGIMSVAVITKILQIWKVIWTFTSNICTSVSRWTVREFFCIYAILLRWMVDILWTFWNSVTKSGGHIEHLHHNF